MFWTNPLAHLSTMFVSIALHVDAECCVCMSCLYMFVCCAPIQVKHRHVNQLQWQLTNNKIPMKTLVLDSLNWSMKQFEPFWHHSKICESMTYVIDALVDWWWWWDAKLLVVRCVCLPPGALCVLCVCVWCTVRVCILALYTSNIKVIKQPAPDMFTESTHSSQNA